MDVGRVVLAFAITVLGAWAVIFVATTEAEEPGCGLGVLGFWAICFIGTASSNLPLGIAAFLGMVVGTVLGFLTAEADVPRP